MERIVAAMKADLLRPLVYEPRILVLIGLITIFNIVNSITMSVAARMKQYGAFRAIGLSNKFLFSYLVSSRWSSPWEIPIAELGIIIAVVTMAVLLAVSALVRKIREMSIVDTISAL